MIVIAGLVLRMQSPRKLWQYHVMIFVVLGEQTIIVPLRLIKKRFPIILEFRSVSYSGRRGGGAGGFGYIRPMALYRAPAPPQTVSE